MQKSNIWYEVRSWALTFVSTFILALGAYEFDVLSLLWSGDISKPAFAALGIACLRTIVKTIMILVFPNLFKVDHSR